MLSKRPLNSKRHAITVPVLPLPELQCIATTFSGSSMRFGFILIKYYFLAKDSILKLIQIINE